MDRSIIRERINAGLRRAKANGKTFGRPRVDPEVEKAIRVVPGKGDKGMRRIARETSAEYDNCQVSAGMNGVKYGRGRGATNGGPNISQGLWCQKAIEVNSPARPRQEVDVMTTISPAFAGIFVVFLVYMEEGDNYEGFK